MMKQLVFTAVPERFKTLHYIPFQDKMTLKSGRGITGTFTQDTDVYLVFFRKRWDKMKDVSEKQIQKEVALWREYIKQLREMNWMPEKNLQVEIKTQEAALKAANMSHRWLSEVPQKFHK